MLELAQEVSHYSVSFNKPYLTGLEAKYIDLAYTQQRLAGDGIFTEKCSTWLENTFDCTKALLTHSCTAALEMAALLIDAQPGDEIIVPSYTFVSTANAFALRGATPVFVDIDPVSLNISIESVKAAITPQTKAIVPVHYAGSACEISRLVEVAKEHSVYLIEDAAQSILSTYDSKPLGSFGDLACLSFHETKNIISGEGGALLINNPKLISRAEIIREKGTNRSQFFRGQVDKYTWQDIGSSYLPGELIASFLWAQLQHAEKITADRLSIWDQYMNFFTAALAESKIQLPNIPADVKHNGHMFYLVLPTAQLRDVFIEKMRLAGIQCVFHYVPLHKSPMGISIGKTPVPLTVTESISDRLVRLPMWIGMDVCHVLMQTKKVLASMGLMES